MRERRASFSCRLPAPDDGAPLSLVGKLPPDHADLLSQGFGPAGLTDAVLPRVHLVQTCLHVMQLLVQGQPPPVLWQEQVCVNTLNTKFIKYSYRLGK